MSRDPFGGEMASILGIMSLFKKVNGIPTKALGTTAYAVDLCTGVVSDALLAKALGMFVRAAVNASHDLDPAKSAKVVRVCFELSEVSGTMSKLHFNTSGELGTKAKSVEAFWTPFSYAAPAARTQVSKPWIADLQ